MQILTVDHTYGAVRTGAKRLAKRWHGGVVSVPITVSSYPSEVVEILREQMTNRTSLVIADQATSSTGRAISAAEIASIRRSWVFPVLISAARAPGVQRAPLSAIDAEYWVGGLRKFARAPRVTRAEIIGLIDWRAALIGFYAATATRARLIDPAPWPRRLHSLSWKNSSGRALYASILVILPTVLSRS